MNKIFMFFFSIFIIYGCAAINERSKKRDLQSQIIRSINKKTSHLAKCAKKHDIYQQFALDRVRVELQVKINSKGQIDTFQLDNKPYSEKFVDCMFNIVDLIVFPALKENEVISLTQPIIFTQN
jgi:hypothetical protein